MTEPSIQLADIGEELTRLWNKAQGEQKIRASLFNLIVYVRQSERSCYYENLVKTVVSKFPCRVILIVNDAAAEKEYLHTSVSSETIGEGDLQIFCEIIHIEAAGALTERVPYIILPQILPDLPVYLLWTQDPATESTILPHLEPLARRIIFDSESTENLQNYSRSVRSLINRFHCAVGDLNWSAFSGWRAILAQAFNSPDTFQALVQSDLIRIVYNENKTEFQKNTEFEAAFLQGWLASRLNWKFQRIEQIEGNIRLTYRRPLKEVAILLVPQTDSTQPPGTILSVDIESALNKGHFVFKKHPTSRQVFVQYSDKDFCQLPYSVFLSGAAAGQEIIDEIFYPSGGKHYREMLDVISTIPWKK